MNPWEDRDDLGWPPAFLDTVRQLLRSPRELFAETDLGRRLGGPLSFAVISLTAGFVLEGISLALLVPLLSRWMPEGTAGPFEVLETQLGFLPDWLVPLLGCQAAFLAIPLNVLFFALALSAWSLLTHAVLAVTGSLRSSTAGMRGTFVAVCYSTFGAFAQVVPALGDVVFAVAFLLVQVAGIREIHGTSRGRAWVAALVPLVLVVSFFVAVALSGSSGQTAVGF